MDKPSWLQEQDPGFNDGLPPARSADPTRPLPTPPGPQVEWQVYGLVDPRSEAIRYVGVTSLPLNRRLQAHFAFLKYGPDVPVCIWTDELALEGLEPIIELIEKTYDRDRVKHWIEFYKPNLLNLSSDGYEQDAEQQQGYAVYKHSYDPRYNKGKPPEGTPAAEMEEWKQHQEAKRKLKASKFIGKRIETTKGTGKQ